jgi:hypothetical protein
MDTNEISCPNCGHLNNYISEGCVKCGIIFSKYLEIQAREKGAVSTESGTAEEEKTVEQALEAKPADGPASVSTDIEAEPDKLQPDTTTPSETEEPLLKMDTIHQDDIEAPAPEVSIADNEAAQIKSADYSEKEITLSPETPIEPQPESSIFAALDKQAESLPESDSIHATSEVQTKAPIEIQQTEENIGQEKSIEEFPASTGTETPPVAADEEILELVEPLTDEKKDRQTPDAEKLEMLDQDQLETVKEEEKPPKTETPQEPSSENAQIAPAAKEQNDLGEQEIKLEAVAVAVTSDDLPSKPDEQARTVLLKKQQAALAKAEALKKEKEAQAKAVALKKQKLAKLEALKKQKAAQSKLEAQRRQRAKLAKAEALAKPKTASARADAHRQQSEAQETAEAAHNQTTTEVQAERPAAKNSTASGRKIMSLLKKYEGKTIGINYDNSSEIRAAELVEANDEFFSVLVKDKKLHYSYPVQTLLSLVEGEDGVEAGEDESKSRFTAIIKVYPVLTALTRHQ